MGYIDSLIKSLGITSDVNASPRKIPKVPVQVRSTVKIKRLTKEVYNLPIQPIRPNRDDCPYFIISRDQRTYPLREIHKFVNQIQICTHGWFCNKCCHEYTGIMSASHSKISPSRSFVLHGRITSILRFMLEIFTEHLVIKELYLTNICGNTRCVNMSHISVILPRELDLPDCYWRSTLVCIHGTQCEICCWDWCGYYMASGSGVMLPTAIVVQPTLTARRAAALTFHWSLKNNEGVFTRCGNTRCVNIHHLYVAVRMSKEVRKKKTLH